MALALARETRIPLAYYAGRLAANYIRSTISRQAHQAASTAFSSARRAVSNYLTPSNTATSVTRSIRMGRSTRSYARLGRRRRIRRAVRTLVKSSRRVRRYQRKKRRIAKAIYRVARPVKLQNHKLAWYDEGDLLIKVDYNQAVDFGNGGSIKRLQDFLFSTYIENVIKDKLNSTTLTMVKLKSYGISMSFPRRAIKCREDTVGLVTNYSTWRDVTAWYDIVGFRDYRGDQRDPSVDATANLAPTLGNEFNAQAIVDHPTHRKFQGSKPIVMRRRVKTAPWVNWQTQLSNTDHTKTIKALCMADNAGFVTWLLELLPTRCVQMVQTGSTDSSPQMKIQAPPFGNYPIWFSCGVIKPWTTDTATGMGNSLYEYHAQFKATYWIRLGVRKRYQPDVTTFNLRPNGTKYTLASELP